MKLTPKKLTLGQYDPRYLLDQKLFDLGAGHLLAMTERSVVQGGLNNIHGEKCVYNGPNGNCCGAAPFLIGYKKVFDTNPMGVPSWRENDIPTGGHDKILQEFQDIHDNNEIEGFYELIKEMAVKFNLEFKY